MEKLDPKKQFISYRLYRDATRFTNGKIVKDLNTLNRPLERIVIVDDNPDCFSMQVSCEPHTWQLVVRASQALPVFEQEFGLLLVYSSDPLFLKRPEVVLWTVMTRCL